MESVAERVMREALLEDPDLYEANPATMAVKAINRRLVRGQAKKIPQDFAAIKRELQKLPWDKAAAKARYYINKFYPNASKDRKSAMVKQAVGTNPKAKRK